MSFTVIIPARHASTRLPGKMLLDLGGKPMVARVAERAGQSSAALIVVATDHADIATALAAEPVRVVMTRVDHESGTDRLAEAATQLCLDDDAIIVNVQGDEPLIAPALIDRVAKTLAAHPEAEMATAARPFVQAADFFSPNCVKVVCDANALALYFSRAPLPFARDAFATTTLALPAEFPALHHIGIYAYRVGFLKRFSALPQSPAEKFEALEQLRALHHGYRIAVTVWQESIEAGVDSAADLARVRRHFG